MVSRRDFLVTTAKTGLVTAASVGVIGCGSGSGGNNSNGGVTINTGSSSGSLSNATTNPGPGEVFIPAASTFNISFPFGPPPRQFTVFLRRFLEPIGGESFDTPTQAIEVSQVNSTTWNVRRRNNFDLDLGGVYFLELVASGGQSERFVYIVSKNRSYDQNPGTGGSLADVDILPEPGSYGVARSLGNQGFEVSWNPNFPPPNSFKVRLRRYKEKRGSDNGGDTEQQVEGQKTGDYIYIVRRRDGFNLDGRAAYYLEVESSGSFIRSAFTTAD